MYVEPHDMRKNMASVKGGGADKKNTFCGKVNFVWIKLYGNY